jgi:TIR domain
MATDGESTTPAERKDSESNTPIVFISYSHDTPAHKKWVAELAAKLIEKGVDIILDQWDLEPGDDVPKFMEQSVKRAHKVLMICTETYVRKADDGKGGVGYESMIVTGELVQNLGTSKFIPVIRQEQSRCTKPVSVSTRFHVNLSEEQDVGEQFDLLLLTSR